MPWCPNCKMEYVEGKTICPDCNTELVATLEEANEIENLEDELNDIVNASLDDEDSYDPSTEFGNRESSNTIKSSDAIDMIVNVLKAKGVPEEEIQGIIESAIRRAEIPDSTYKCIKDRYEENRSSAAVLIGCGIIGVVVLLLNALKIINLPFHGSSFWIVTIVLGLFFLIFVFSGIRSVMVAKKLQPELAVEEDKITMAVNYLKELYDTGRFSMYDDLPMEEKSLVISNMAVSSLEGHFDDLAPGFAYYVTDRFYSEIFESDNEILGDKPDEN